MNVNSMVKGKETHHDSMENVNNGKPSTSKVCNPLDRVVVEDYVSNEDDVSRVIVEQVYEESKEYTKMLKDKGQQYMESNSVVYKTSSVHIKLYFQSKYFSPLEMMIRRI